MGLSPGALTLRALSDALATSAAEWADGQGPTCGGPFNNIKISLYAWFAGIPLVPTGVATDAGSRASRLRRPQRRPQGRRRGDAAAHPGTAVRGRIDGLGPDRDPAAIAAAHLAPSQAPGRGRAGGALPRGGLGLFPPRRAGAGRSRDPLPAGAARPRRPGDRARPRAARRGPRRASRGRSALFQG